MNIKPLADRVLIKPVAAEEKTVGGIIIPDSAKEKPLKGNVVAVGKGTQDEEMVLKAGDSVLYGKFAGTELELEGERFLIMRHAYLIITVWHFHGEIPGLGAVLCRCREHVITITSRFSVGGLYLGHVVIKCLCR